MHTRADKAMQQEAGNPLETRMDNSVIKTAGRVFEILEYFREVRKPLSVRDIAEHLCASPPRCHLVRRTRDRRRFDSL